MRWKLYFFFLVLSYSFVSSADSLSSMQEYLYREGFRYRDAYSGPVDSFESVNQWKVSFSDLLNIGREKAIATMMEELDFLNDSSASISECERALFQNSGERGAILNFKAFVDYHQWKDFGISYSFVGKLPRCEIGENCEPRHLKMERKYSCSAFIGDEGKRFYEYYFTKLNTSATECNRFASDLLKMDSSSILLELYMEANDRKLDCSVNLLHLKK